MPTIANESRLDLAQVALHTFPVLPAMMALLSAKAATSPFGFQKTKKMKMVKIGRPQNETGFGFSPVRHMAQMEVIGNRLHSKRFPLKGFRQRRSTT